MSEEKQLVLDWIKALNSGEFKQGMGSLKTITREGEVRHCCLGVLCEIAKIKEDALFALVDGSTVVEFKGHAKTFLPEHLANKISLSWSVMNDLAKLNDKGYDFKYISEEIKRYYFNKGWF